METTRPDLYTNTADAKDIRDISAPRLKVLQNQRGLVSSFIHTSEDRSIQSVSVLFVPMKRWK